MPQGLDQPARTLGRVDAFRRRSAHPHGQQRLGAPPARARLGRKNYYGSGAFWSGRLAAMLFSILATLKLWQINPRLWLRWFLDSCAAAGGQAPTDIQPFLPWNLSREKLAELSVAGEPATPDSS